MKYGVLDSSTKHRTEKQLLFFLRLNVRRNLTDGLIPSKEHSVCYFISSDSNFNHYQGAVFILPSVIDLIDTSGSSGDKRGDVAVVERGYFCIVLMPSLAWINSSLNSYKNKNRRQECRKMANQPLI